MSGGLLLCTGNAHKAAEIRAVLGAGVLVFLPAEIDVNLEVVEDGETFAANALKKARLGMEMTGLCALADDSGLCVDALSGKPGVHSARFAADHGKGGGDGDNNALLLEKLRTVPDALRGARFVCVLALCEPGGAEHTFQGELPGRIGHERRGTHGFGYDPLFVLDDGRCLAELPPDEKNRISHRARALAAARDALLRAAGGPPA